MADSEQLVCLHGDLDLRIVEARHLPNMDVVTNHLRSCVTVCGTIKCSTRSAAADPNDSDDGGGGGGSRSDRKIHHHARIITSDPYVTVTVPQATVARTRVIKNSQNPYWNERFHIPLAHPVVHLEFHVKDNDLFGADLIGTVGIAAADLATGKIISGWFPILNSSGKPPKPDTALRLEMNFTPCEKNPLYRHGIAGDPEEKGARHTYFPLRKGNSVRLYQDAHVVDHLLPDIKLDGGKVNMMIFLDFSLSLFERNS